MASPPDVGNPAAESLLARIQERTAAVGIVGLGYVGLPTAVHFAKQGFTVVGMDVDASKVDAINRGESPLGELGLDEDVQAMVDTGRLRASTEAAALSECDVISIIVPTPVTAEKEPDLSMVEAASKAVASIVRKGALVALESTTYPGTCEDIVIPALEAAGHSVGPDVGVAYCPERYNPGDKEHTIDNVHRVFAAIDDDWAAVADALWGTLNGGRIHRLSSLKAAEACKVIENVQRDLNIALVNELALICERIGIDVHDVLEGAATKWNFHHYKPGPGVGGHCLPVDPYYLTTAAQRAGYEPKVILAGRAVNDSMPGHVVRRLEEALGGLEGKTVAVLGLAYKAGTGDARESPAKAVVSTLSDRGARIALHDPCVDPQQARRIFGQSPMGLEEALDGIDAAIIVTGHHDYGSVCEDLARLAPHAILFDCSRLAIYAPGPIEVPGRQP